MLTATVTTSGPTPNFGAVQFMDGATALGAPITVDQSGAAKLATILTSGTHQLTAAYSGGASAYASSHSKAVTVTVSVADFAIASKEPSATIAAGQSATFHLTVTPTGPFASAIAFSCSGLPAAAACIFTPPAVTPNSAPATLQLTINTQASAALIPLHNLNDENAPRLAHLALFAVALVAAFRIPRRRMTALLAVVAIALITSNCGAGSSHLTGVITAPATPTGTTQITIFATSGTLTHTSTVTLIVQ